MSRTVSWLSYPLLIVFLAPNNCRTQRRRKGRKGRVLVSANTKWTPAERLELTHDIVDHGGPGRAAWEAYFAKVRCSLIGSDVSESSRASLTSLLLPPLSLFQHPERTIGAIAIQYVNRRALYESEIARVRKERKTNGQNVPQAPKRSASPVVPTGQEPGHWI